MSKVFIIPDVHLKPWIFEKASALVAKGMRRIMAENPDLKIISVLS